MISENKNYKNGFTVIELVLSIFVLSIAIIGAYNAFTVMDILTENSSDRFTAAYLAQEGIEIVRNIRDTNWLNRDDGRLWTDGLAECTLGCQADYKTFGTETTPLISYDENVMLRIDENGFYSYDALGEETKFKRKITITPLQVPGAEEGVFDILKVSVEVFWSEKENILLESGAEQSITVEEYLYNWF